MWFLYILGVIGFIFLSFKTFNYYFNWKCAKMEITPDGITKNLLKAIRKIKKNYTKEYDWDDSYYWMVVNLANLDNKDKRKQDAYMVYNKGRSDYWLVYQNSPQVRYHYNSELEYDNPTYDERLIFDIPEIIHGIIITNIQEALRLRYNAKKERNTRIAENYVKSFIDGI